MPARVLFSFLFGYTVSAIAVTQTLAPGTVFRDCPDCPEMVVVPAGSFVMGSPESEVSRDKDEGPQHAVTIARSFAVGRHEVTRGQFTSFVTESGYQSQGGNCWYWDGEEGKGKDDDPNKSWREPGFPQNDRHPVVCVSWNDAKAYAEWLTKKTGNRYRLLSEAEWEYAARAGTSTARPWGDEASEACQYANVGDLTRNRVVSPGANKQWLLFHDCDDGSAYTAHVGSYRRNAFGLYDMIGNVWEWTEDCYNDSYSGAPTDGAAWLSGDCARRVDRGASWHLNIRVARSAKRHGAAVGNRYGIVGFRLAKTLTE